MVTEKDKLLAEAKEEVKRVKTDYAEAEARTVVAYQDGFKDMLDYKDLARHFMTAGREQLVKRIAETHLEWDISFLRHPSDKVLSSAEPQSFGEAQTLLSTTIEGPQCADPSETVG
ncbi:hypothetical protein Adt_45985 [Abeliophyllum distichum]|uniref:Uncharacterized protein n=1 Tax=Abeliophyllum distichum TaxID=126358 RepID=A0ABD1P3A5_9LAMI